MEELILDEKKYVSSKRAAKITGYAKDYIGQLCREGRVPARLVGRSWYVLESAIQDHRFGANPNPKEGIFEKEINDSVAVLSKNWYAPRYESVEADEIPQVKKETVFSAVAQEVSAVEDSLRDAWEAWFDHVSSGFGTEANEKITPEASEEAQKDAFPMPEADKSASEPAFEGERVKIRAIYQPALTAPPLRARKELDKEINQVLREVESIRVETPRIGERSLLFAVSGAFIALIAITTAVIGTGKFDNYISSIQPASFIAGVSMYQK